MQSEAVGHDYIKDDCQQDSVGKFTYGKFLLENMNKPDMAKEYLIIARKLSTGKHWNVKKIFPNEEDTVFAGSSLLLHKVLMIEVNEVMKYDSLEAAKICALARKRANDACYHEGEANALMLKAMCEMEANLPNIAQPTLMRVLALQTRLNNLSGICEAHIQLALAFLKLGRLEDSNKNLEILLNFATEHNLQFYIAQAYRYLGEYYLNEGTAVLATPLLIKALQIFHELDDILNREQSRNLAAVSRGQELIGKYVGLILRCGRQSIGQISLARLLKWKDSRVLFYSDSQDILEGSKSSSYTGLLEIKDTEEEVDVISEVLTEEIDLEQDVDKKLEDDIEADVADVIKDEDEEDIMDLDEDFDETFLLLGIPPLIETESTAMENSSNVDETLQMNNAIEDNQESENVKMEEQGNPNTADRKAEENNIE